MKLIKSTLAMAVLCLTMSVSAQDLFDIHRYSSTNYQGNARSMATGNSMGALGGTPIATSLNPAGLAAYPTSEFSLSLGFANPVVESSYLDSKRDNGKFSLNLPSVGYVFSEKNSSREKQEGWISKHFGITLNRVNGFNSETLFTGVNTANSMTDFFADDFEYAWFNDPYIDSNTYGGMAWFAELIDPLVNEDGDTVDFAPSISDLQVNDMEQRQLISSRGNITELNLSYAGNYNDQILVGATIGFPVLNYREVRTFEEYNNLADVDNYNSLTLKERVEDNGIGVFGKIGVIFKPVPFARFGLAVKSPTLYSVNRTFSTTLTADTDGRYSEITPVGYDYNYIMNTSWEANISTAFLLKGIGFISADYSYYDGSLAGLRSEGSNGKLDYIYENDDIAGGLQAVHKLSIGAEYTYENFALRGGYSLATPGFKKGYQPDETMNSPETISFGIGYRETKVYMDLGWQSRTNTTFFQPYSHSEFEVEGATNKEVYNSLVFTVGFNF